MEDLRQRLEDAEECIRHVAHVMGPTWHGHGCEGCQYDGNEALETVHGYMDHYGIPRPYPLRGPELSLTISANLPDS